MKKLLFILPLLCMISCTVQKRKYRDGFYVNWLNHEHSRLAPVAKKAQPSQVPAPRLNNEKEIEKEALTASAGEAIFPPAAKRAIAPGDSCDMLIFKDGSEIAARIIEMGITEIKYRRCDNPQGPLYTSRRSELFMVKYNNGTKEIIKSEEPQRQSTDEEYRNYKIKKKKRMIHPGGPFSMALGILSFILLYASLILATISTFPLTLFIIGLLAAGLAVLLGRNAIRRTNEAPEVYKAKGFAITGMIIGLVILGITATVMMIIFIAVI